jgi:hypothetical protein
MNGPRALSLTIGDNMPGAPLFKVVLSDVGTGVAGAGVFTQVTDTVQEFVSYVSGDVWNIVWNADTTTAIRLTGRASPDGAQATNLTCQILLHSDKERASANLVYQLDGRSVTLNDLPVSGGWMPAD